MLLFFELSMYEYYYKVTENIEKFLHKNFFEMIFLPKFSNSYLTPINFTIMSKGTDAKKEKKKEPTKSLKEKRAEKKAKKAGKND
jgi:hypothetical protein